MDDYALALNITFTSLVRRRAWIFRFATDIAADRSRAMD